MEQLCNSFRLIYGIIKTPKQTTMKKLVIHLVALICTTTFAQNHAFFDFGKSSNATKGNWNNVVVTDHKQDGLTFNVIDSEGNDTNIVFTLTDSFDFINSSGALVSDEGILFPSSASMDSFFGSTGFSGYVDPTGGFTLSGLDMNKYYSFSIFASRNNVNDNREALYTVTGATTKTKTLDASNNKSNTADILNLQPNESGEIYFQAESGPNNNSSVGFFYLGAIQLIVSDTPIAHTTPDPKITLKYPNGGHIWEVGKTVRLKWESISVPEILIEFSPDSGITWKLMSTVSGSQQHYDMVVPNNISTKCLIRISGGGLSTISENTFEVIPNEDVVYKIVILGSSTAAGAGPTDVNDAWVWKYNTNLTEMDTRYEVINLAAGGYATYNILPNGSTIPYGINRTINPERNITKALSFQPSAIIINLPSNDAASGYSVSDQLNNYSIVDSVSTAAGVPLWVASPQPRYFGTNASKVDIQLAMNKETYTEFRSKTIDFWTGFGPADGNGIIPIYDSGDGIHMTAAAHQILYDRVLDKNIHKEIKNTVDNALSVKVQSLNNFTFFPNPVFQQATIKLKENFSGDVNISVINMIGQEFENQKYKVQDQTIIWKRRDLNSGFYILTISYDAKSYSHKIYVN